MRHKRSFVDGIPFALRPQKGPVHIQVNRKTKRILQLQELLPDRSVRSIELVSNIPLDSKRSE